MTQIDFEFTLAAFNVFLRWRWPIFADGQRHRAEKLAPYLDDPSFDAVALCELFDPASRERLLELLRPSFPFRTRLVGGEQSGWLRGNGGVMVLSRWPIEIDAERVFHPRAPLEERFVNKGVVYARIVKRGRRVHVFAVHAYARWRAHAVRRRQIETVAQFVRARDIPHDEPVLIAGDLNIHRGCHEDYRAMLDTLDAHHPIIIGHDSTYDPHHNRLASGSARLFLDYVLYSRKHRIPVSCTNEVVRPICPDWRAFPWQPGYRELSDHFPVIGRFVF
jgi:sphingomyelin phosphodiesterase